MQILTSNYINSVPQFTDYATSLNSMEFLLASKKIRMIQTTGWYTIKVNILVFFPCIKMINELKLIPSHKI